jgi:hypothetical protein
VVGSACVLLLLFTMNLARGFEIRAWTGLPPVGACRGSRRVR